MGRLRADTSIANNPWGELPPEPPFVLRCDALAVEQYQAADPPASHRLHLELLPEPFLGRPNAPVVLLNLNPGFNDEDILAYGDPEFAEAAGHTMLHAPQTYPFYLLDPRFRDASGARWWRTHLGQLLERYGDHRIANTVACIEYFPYHSEHFGFATALPSQQYSIELVRSGGYDKPGALHRRPVLRLISGASSTRAVARRAGDDRRPP